LSLFVSEKLALPRGTDTGTMSTSNGVQGMKLTGTKIKRQPITERDVKLTDGRGLYLLVKKNGGSRLWRYKFNFGGKEQLMALGEYPVVTLEAARQKHLAARRLLDAGINPMDQRKQDKVTGKVFDEVFTEWYSKERSGWSNRHAGYVLRRYQADIKSSLGGLGIGQVKATDVTACVLSIEGRAAEMARRALSTINNVFVFAVTRGYAPTNPVAGIKPSALFKPAPTANFARVSDGDLPELLRALDKLPGTGTVKLGAKLLALTMLRTRELTEMRWSEIFDLDGKEPMLKIEASRMKMRVEFKQPLSYQAAEMFRALRVLNGDSEFVFPADRDSSKPINSVSILRAIERAGYKGRQTGHGFRSLGATVLSENGTSDRVIDAILAHSRKGVIGAYVKDQRIAEKREALQWLADHYDKLRAISAVAA